MIEKVKQYVPQFFEGNMLAYGIVLIVLGCCLFVVSGQLWISWNTALETQKQIDTMHQYIFNWNEKAQKINNEPYKAVSTEQIDDIQSNLLFALQAHKLEMSSFKNMTTENEKTEKAENGKSFEMSFKGSWSDTVHFLSNFHVRDALLSIRNLNLQPDKDGSVKTSLQYKIYTK